MTEINKIFIDNKHDADFKKNGYVVLDLLTETNINELYKVFDTVKEQHNYDYVASVVLPDLEMRLAVHQGILQVFENNLLQVLHNYKIVLGSFVAKKAASQYGKFPLHQDPTFVEEEGQAGISIWCPLVNVDENNGCLGVLPGSHKLKNLYRSATMLPYPDLVEIIETSYLQYLPMKAGQVLFMNTRMIHGSPPNLSGQVRPVAAGVAIPAKASLLCCYVDEATNPGVANVYQVPDDFYLSYIMQSQPENELLQKSVSRQVEEMTKEKMAMLSSRL